MNSTERVFSEIVDSTFAKDSSVIVAFSGGCDSLCLLALCSKILGPERTFPVYVNHNIRSEEELSKEIALNTSNCRKLGLSLEVCTLEPGLVEQVSKERRGGIEDAARALRYKALEQKRLEHCCNYILTAHHKQDQVETIVMRLGRGTPFSSLKGISRIDEKRHLMRPLLDFSRKELEFYLKGLGLEWSTDSTNSDSSYLRNHVRNEVIPKLGEIMPEYEDLLLDLGRQAEKSMLSDETKAETRLSVEAFMNQDPKTSASRIFAMWDVLFKGKDLPLSLVDRVLRAISEGKDCNIGSNGAIFCIYRGYLYLVDPSCDELFQNYEAEIDVKKGLEVQLPGGICLLSGSFAEQQLDDPLCDMDEKLALRMDSNAFKGRTVLRFAKVGDQIRLKDGKKMVMRLLQDMHVPACLRKRVPVIEDEEGICAVFGSCYGSNDRICVKFRTSLAPNRNTLYICSKG